jgi:hypothetical protein
MLRRTEVSRQMWQLGHSLHSRLLPTRFFVRCAPNSDRSIAGVANDATGQTATSVSFVRSLRRRGEQLVWNAISSVLAVLRLITSLNLVSC